MAENMLLWHIWAPVREYTLVAPGNNQIYPDHPFGTYWVIAILERVFGRHSFVPRLEPIAFSVATPALLYGIGKSLWGPMHGALCALAYVVLPITLSFGNFPGFEVPLIFGILLTTWGYLRYAKGYELRWLLVSLAGVLWTVSVDWQGCVFLGTALGSLLITSLLLPRWFGHVSPRDFGRWWALSVSVATVAVLAYGAYLIHIDGIDTLLSQKALRERGSDQPLLGVLGGRWYWIDSAFTPLAVTAGKIALPIFFLRVVALKKTAEIFPLAILVMASITYAHFKNGADAHFYWPMPFAAYWALSVGVLTETILDIQAWTRRRLGWVDRRGIWRPVTFGVVGLIVLSILPDGIRSIPYGMGTGGRFNDRGRRIFQDVDKGVALGWMSERMEGKPRVQLHNSMSFGWANDYALRRPVSYTEGIAARATVREEERYWIGDLAFLHAGDQQKLAGQCQLKVVWEWALCDKAAPMGPLDAYVFDSREPNPLEWYLVSPVEPVRAVRPDPWRTWELRDTFGQSPNPTPTQTPVTTEELRVAHNAALATGNTELAARYKADLQPRLESFPSTKFTDGTMLLGDHYTPGASPTLEVYLEAAGPTPDEDQFDLESMVVRRPIVSIVGRDDRIRTLGRPMVPPPKLWKPGFIYVSRTVIRQRPGREVFVGFFTAPEKAHPPVPLDGSGKVRLLTLD
jgi:hypothetical protein